MSWTGSCCKYSGSSAEASRQGTILRTIGMLAVDTIGACCRRRVFGRRRAVRSGRGITEQRKRVGHRQLPRSDLLFRNDGTRGYAMRIGGHPGPWWKGRNPFGGHWTHWCPNSLKNRKDFPLLTDCISSIFHDTIESPAEQWTES